MVYWLACLAMNSWGQIKLKTDQNAFIFGMIGIYKLSETAPAARWPCGAEDTFSLTESLARMSHSHGHGRGGGSCNSKTNSDKNAWLILNFPAQPFDM